MSAPSPLQTPRRVRERAFLRGRLAWRAGAVLLDCTVLDLSAAGARIRGPLSHGLPSLLHFLDLRSGAVFHARLAWFDHPEAGLDFLYRCEASDPAPEVVRLLAGRVAGASSVF